MIKETKYIPILTIVCVGFLFCAIESDAQLFNKISKGLEKVNKGLEKVNKGIESLEKAKKGKEKNKQNNENSQSSSNSIPSQPVSIQSDNTSPDGDEDFELGKGQNDEIIDFTTLGAVNPHVTDKTKILFKQPANYMSEILPVSEGIFATREYNRNYGYASYYGFWTLDGKRLTDNKFESSNGEEPLFDNGAVVLKDLPNAKNYQPFLILYADGTAKRLPETYRMVSQFHDGVAVVEETGKPFSKGFCIDTKGNKIWPQLSVNNTEVIKVGPLRDGLRLVEIRRQEIVNHSYKCETNIGFIDNNGNWVIKPELRLAQDFKNGYSIVEDKKGNYKVIDTKGNVVYEMGSSPKFGNYSDGYFIGYSGGKYFYYDKNGDAKNGYILASPFHEGYAFVSDYDQFTGYPHVNIIDTNFNVVGSLGPNYWIRELPDSHDITDRKVGSSNLFTLSGKYVVTPKGEVKVVEPDRANGQGDYWQSQIGDFFPGEYAACQRVYCDDRGNSHKYAGYINTKGEYEVVICNDEIAMRMLPGKEVNGRYEVSLTPVDTIPIGPKYIN